MGWSALPEPVSGNGDNNFGGYQGAVPTGDFPHSSSDPDGGYGSGVVYPNDDLGPTGDLAHLGTSDGYSSKLNSSSNQ